VCRAHARLVLSYERTHLFSSLCERQKQMRSADSVPRHQPQGSLDLYVVMYVSLKTDTRFFMTKNNSAVLTVCQEYFE